MTNEYLEGPIIINPITRKNAAKNSFRIEDVKEAFGLAFDYVQGIKIKFDKCSSKLQDKNIVHEIHLNNY